MSNNFNLLIGREAGRSLNSSDSFDGEFNTIIGQLSGVSLTTSSRNTFVGYRTGANTKSGAANTFLGESASFMNETGNWNISIGFQAGTEIIDGDRNIFIGNNSGGGCGDCSNSIFIGHQLGDYNTTSDFGELYIGTDASPSGIALIHGNFTDEFIEVNGSLHINDLAKLKPLNTQPTNPEKGTIYYDNNDDKVKVWTGTNWENLN